jgi:hypothetical protein
MTTSVHMIGVTGAKHQSWQRANPRDMLKRLIEKNPKANKDELFNLFCEAVENEPMIIEVIIEYWYINNYQSLMAPRLTAKVATAYRREAITTALKARATAVIEKKAKIILLDMVMPSGKKLRDTTFAACAELGERMGQWLSDLSVMGAPNQKIGSVLTEDQVRQVYEEQP